MIENPRLVSVMAIIALFLGFVPPFMACAGADIKPPLTGQLLAKGDWVEDAPTLPTIKFDAPNGVQINTQDYKGQWVILHYWATWCAPCVTELPSLNKLQKDWAATKLKIITASADTGGPIMVQTYFKKNKLKYLPAFTVIPDEDLGLPINGIPTTFILNPRQEVLLKFEGSIDWSNPVVREFLAKLMGVKPPTK